MIAIRPNTVKIGFERMNKTQYEVLWNCETALTPILGTTQVLESMCKEALATKGEITDAAPAQEADCIINNGKYFIDAFKRLTNIVSTRCENSFKNGRFLERYPFQKTNFK